MDGKGARRDHGFVERLWLSIKYEEVYLHAFKTVSEAPVGIGRYLTFYNTRRQLQRAGTNDVGDTMEAEIYAAKCPILFSQTEPYTPND